MAGAKTITVELDPDTASISVDTNGFQGQGCDAIHKMFANIGTVTASKKKPEYKQQTLSRVKQ